MTATIDDLRKFLEDLLLVVDEARHKITSLDTACDGDWHRLLREVFVVIDRPASMTLNAMNSEALRRNRERASQRQPRKSKV